MDRGAMLTAALLCCWSCSLCVVTAIRRTDLFPFGILNGDVILPEGDDETSRALTLPRPLYFFDSPFSQLYVATNGIISAQDLPMEKQYVDDGLPTDFPVVAPFLADIDTSGGRGNIYYRVTETPSVLNRFAQEVHRGFPEAKFTPTHAVVATWENVAAYEEQARATNKVNTFQAVIGYDETDSFILFLYPEDGLNFFGTRPKESYNVEIELPARVGFSRGEVPFFIISKTDGPFYSVAQDENGVKRLSQVGNTGVPGVWLFQTGKRYSFQDIIPASIGGLLAVPSTVGYGLYLDPTTREYEFEDYAYVPETQEEVDSAGSDLSDSLQPRSSNSPPSHSKDSNRQLSYNREDVPLPLEPVERQYAPSRFPLTGLEGRTQQVQEQQPQFPLEVVDVYPPLRSKPPLSPGGHVVSVDEDDVDFDTGVIQYTTENKETCARFQQQCSQNAFCSDYTTGFCCHCRPGFYGNGRQCLPDGAPQRVSGKVSGMVVVGSTPVELNNIDLHAYIVVGDGRAYTAISEVPEPVGWAMMSVSPIGELFGWLFALELPNSKAGFKITGAEFSRHAEVVFNPGNQRLSIMQTGHGLDEHNHLSVDTVINGNVPFVPPGAEVTMKPFKETYQYYPSVATSTSVREFSVGLPEQATESYTFHLKQNITYRDCRHDTQAATLETLQINMERVFVMYVKEERILRYAITNKISPVGDIDECSSSPCHISARCINEQGSFQCQCLPGFYGDGFHCSPQGDRLRTQCEQHRDSLQSGGQPSIEAYIPQCDSEGQYRPRQCHGSTGHCWCVDSRGQEKPGTRTPPGTAPQICDTLDEPEHPKTLCEHHRDSVQTTSPDGRPPAGAYVPQCDENGQYRQLQCHSSTGYCWCVDSRGAERPGTRTPPGTPPIDCDKPERPKTHCEHYRGSVQTTSPDGLPLLGVYVPQCDENGQYLPQQCHGSDGYCWCVDSSGQERAGTRTPPGTSRVDCSRAEEPEGPKTHCEHHRDSVLTSSDGHPPPGAYVPQCDENGQYLPEQCHGSTGHCWCVDSRGQERAGTRTPPGTPNVDCIRADDPERPKTQCEHHRDSVQTSSPDRLPPVGVYVPQCDENGLYLPQQCHGSTGHCWCVDSRGQERAGTRSPPGTPRVDCSRADEPERPKTHCEHHRDSVQTTSPDGRPLLGVYVPQCDEIGLYLPQQCHGSTGHCWCVDSRGQERAGTRTPPGAPRVDCSRSDEPERPKTHCEHQRDNVLTSSGGFPPPGAYVPQCDENGLYRPQQCHGSTGHCWCVDSTGQERAGTRTPPGTPNVNCIRTDEPDRPKTPCEHHKERVQASSSSEYPVAGAYVPQCDADGQYIPLQCHTSTGYCWCVDEGGQERAGTRTPPGAQPKDCAKPDAPKTHCEEQRDRAQASIQERYPTAGGFVPRCDAQGQYLPQQCHGSTGHCWCVDSSGQERAGTRTAPGATPVDCRKPAPNNRPESVCERWRASLIEHYLGNPDPQQYLPQCEPDGEFSPVQCYGESTYCWCVDQEGREVPGTRSHDVVKPACLPSVAPPIVRPVTRPDVTPPTKTDVTLLYAQGQKIGALPLNGTRLDAEHSKTLLTLHGSIVVGIAYDCKENKVYWTDLSARTINRASMASGAEPEMLINTNLVSPEGLALDAKRRLMFWVDSNMDVIESANLDGSRRRTLFDSDLVNPRAIIVVSSTGNLYWTDWNREAPKIETSTVDGQGRRVVVSDRVGLPNALTYDFSSGQICWADAGTKHLECISPNGSGRRVINSDLNYPFSMVYYNNHFYFSDWRRDGVIAVNKDSSKFTDEYLPEQRSHLYGITIATTHCLPGSH
ncbi:nidogen-2 isoform 2-T2 [Anableps anableps]